jgi:hypothetical protein
MASQQAGAMLELTIPTAAEAEMTTSTRTRTINIGTPERIARVVLGGLAAVVGVAILAGGPGAWGIIGALLLVAAGLDFVVTGATGYCPLYARLGHVPRSRHAPR